MSRRLSLLIVLAALPGPAAAQPLTLDEAIVMALARHPVVRAAAAGEDAARAGVAQARAGWLPRVDLTEGWQRGDQPVFVFSSLLSQRRFTAADFALDALNHPDAISNHRAAVSLEQPLFDGFRTKALVRAARLGADIAALESARTRADLRLEVVQAFGRALAAAAQAEAATSAVETAAEDLRRARDRREAGVETDATVLALQVQLAEAEFRVVRSGADAGVTRAALNSLLDLPLDDDRPLAALGASSTPPLDLAALEAQALRDRPEVAQAAARQAQAEAMLAAARAAHWPDVVGQAGAEANGGSFGDRRTAWSAGVQVRWRVFAGGAHAARIAEAAAGAARAEAERERLERGIRLAVRAAAAEHEAARARERTSRLMVERARESQRIIRDRYDAGLAPASELLRAAELTAQAEAARIAATVDIHLTAAALDRAAARTP